jgi:hypothetical protein
MKALNNLHGDACLQWRFRPGRYDDPFRVQRFKLGHGNLVITKHSAFITGLQ